MQNDAHLDLVVYRAKIDAIDRELVELLSQRAKYAQAIGRIKVGEICDPSREAEVLSHVQLANHGPLSNQAIIQIFQEIIVACRALQYLE